MLDVLIVFKFLGVKNCTTGVLSLQLLACFVLTGVLSLSFDSTLLQTVFSCFVAFVDLEHCSSILDGLFERPVISVISCLADVFSTGHGVFLLAF